MLIGNFPVTIEPKSLYLFTETLTNYCIQLFFQAKFREYETQGFIGDQYRTKREEVKWVFQSMDLDLSEG